MVLTDHSARLTIAHGLDRERLERQLADIEALNDGFDDFRILTGMEVDIFEDGTLDLADDLLARLDVVVASVHSKLRMERQQMTERMIVAVANPHVDILGHCTGRMIGRRPPSTFDADYVFAACKQFGTAVEINCRPERLDPPRELLDLAIDYGCWFSIDTDAHATGQLEWQAHGCDRAAERDVPIERVINTMSADDSAGLDRPCRPPSERSGSARLDARAAEPAEQRRQPCAEAAHGGGRALRRYRRRQRGVPGRCAAHVADGALAHLVHHVAEAHPGVEVDDRQRAAPAAPEARPLVGGRAASLDRQAEADAVAQRHPSTRSVPLHCSSNTASMVSLPSRRTPLASPPHAIGVWIWATERALPWPPAAGISARRHGDVPRLGGVEDRVAERLGEHAVGVEVLAASAAAAAG